MADKLKAHDAYEVLSVKSDFAMFPRGADSTDGHGISNRLNVSVAGSFLVPTHWKGRYLTVKTRKSAFVVSMTPVTKALVFAQSSPPDNAVDEAGWPVEAYETMPDRIVPNEETLWFNYAPEGTGDLFFVISEPDVVGLDGVK
jgi:hypothetical protein